MPAAAVFPFPLQVWIGFPILYVMISAYLFFVPLYASPVETGIGVLIMLTGIPIYLIFIKWKSKPPTFVNAIGTFV